MQYISRHAKDLQRQQSMATSVWPPGLAAQRLQDKQRRAACARAMEFTARLRSGALALSGAGPGGAQCIRDKMAGWMREERWGALAAEAQGAGQHAGGYRALVRVCNPVWGAQRIQDKVAGWMREERWGALAAEKREVLASMQEVLRSCHTLLNTTQIPMNGVVNLLQHILRCAPRCRRRASLTKKPLPQACTAFVGWLP